ncbi:hypothetical protein [Amycolatopsis tolypomycina]|uniref:hypothetical protein n=1 Tax=Amycolatopsis tolypomycina TaxID=208445 RepID=UPI0033A1152A
MTVVPLITEDENASVDRGVIMCNSVGEAMSRLQAGTRDQPSLTDPAALAAA